jgi:uncharacterized protein (UPF0335 family)
MAGGKQKQPTMKRTSDTSQVPSFYARWERLETARRESSEDLKELFSEAKAFGLNGKALRVVFAEKYRDENEDAGKRSKRLETGADVELYRSALARVRESDDQEQPNVPVQDGGEAKSIRSSRTGGEEPTPSAKFPVDDKQVETVLGYEPADAIPPDGKAVVEAGVPSAASAPIQPETANEVPDAAPHGAAGEEQSPVATDADAHLKLGDRANGGGKDEGPVVVHQNSTQHAGAGEGETSSAPGSTVTVLHDTNGRIRPRSSEGLPRPYGCQNVDACATTWRAEQPCTLCRAEIAVEAGGVEIQHRGQVS